MTELQEKGTFFVFATMPGERPPHPRGGGDIIYTGIKGRYGRFCYVWKINNYKEGRTFYDV
jgi:hypothetical protein